MYYRLALEFFLQYALCQDGLIQCEINQHVLYMHLMLKIIRYSDKGSSCNDYDTLGTQLTQSKTGIKIVQLQ